MEDELAVGGVAEEGGVWKSLLRSTFFFSFSTGLGAAATAGAGGAGEVDLDAAEVGAVAAAGVGDDDEGGTVAPSLTVIGAWPRPLLVAGGVAALASSVPNERTAAASRWEPVTGWLAGEEERVADESAIEPKLMAPVLGPA